MKKWLRENNYTLFFELKYWYYQLLLLIPSRIFISYRFKKKMGFEPNLKNPKGYNEKLLWLMLHWRDKKAKICADKYLVRDYVREKIGDNLLNEVYQIVDKSDDIDFEALPKQFVVKSTQGSGMNYICINKDAITKEDIRKKVIGYTHKNFFYSRGREWVYKDMQPQILIEKFLGKNGEVPKDYKFYCFAGEPFMVQVDINRFRDAHRENWYDTQWNLMDIQDLDCPSDSTQIEPKPKEFEQMLEYAKILSRDFPHVRVDFYIVEGKVFFGELTFFSSCGMSKWDPYEFDLELGNKIKLPLKNKRKK